MKKLMLLFFLFVIIATLMAGCSDDAPAIQEEPEATGETEALIEDETAAELEDEADDEVLFTPYTIPSDWPKTMVPIMHEFNVTSYERTDNSMYAAGYAEILISRVNNYYLNARKVAGTSFDWEFDPTKNSVTEGDDQVFFYVDDEDRTLTIMFRKVEDDIVELELDFKE